MTFKAAFASTVLLSTFLFAGLEAYGQADKERGDENRPVQAEQFVIVVTATKTPHALGDIPVAAEVISKEMIEQKKYKTVQDALKYLAGIKVNKNTGSWGDKGKVQIQGLDAKHTLVLVDGQRVLGGHEDAVDLEQISTEMVERIEIVKGPASALYGSDAIGGVINIITKSAPSKATATASTSFGSWATQIHELGGGFKTGQLGGTFNYTFRKSNGVAEETDRYQENILQGNIQYEFSPSSKLSLKPYFSNQNMSYGGRKQVRLGLNSTWEWAPDEASKMNWRASWNNYKHWTDDRASDWVTNYYEAEVNYSRRLLKRHNVTGGYNILRESIDDPGKGYEARQVLHSFFLQDEISYNPFIVILGARFDDHDKWGSELNFNTGLLFNATEKLKWRGSVGTAFKGPSLAKLYGDGWRMGPYTVFANPDLKPEESVGYRLGAEYIFSRKASARVSLFRNDLKNLVSYRILGRGLYWENVDRAMTQGLEIDFSSRLTAALTAKLGYTLLDTEDKSTGRELIYRPRHKAGLVLGYEVPRIGLDLHLEGEYLGRRYADDGNTTLLGAYPLLNVSMAKTLGREFQVFLRLDNILNEKGIADEYDINGTRLMGGVRARI